MQSPFVPNLRILSIGGNPRRINVFQASGAGLIFTTDVHVTVAHRLPSSLSAPSFSSHPQAHKNATITLPFMVVIYL
jgi:hypothetical protein